MSYTFNPRVINDTADTLSLVEKTCYYGNSCTLVEREGGHFWSMGQSGTSGMLRFKTSKGETFLLPWACTTTKDGVILIWTSTEMTLVSKSTRNTTTNLAQSAKCW